MLVQKDVDNVASVSDATREPTAEAEPTGCEQSGLCSLKHVKSFMGDVYPSAGLKASLLVSEHQVDRPQLYTRGIINNPDMTGMCVICFVMKRRSACKPLQIVTGDRAPGLCY